VKTAHALILGGLCYPANPLQGVFGSMALKGFPAPSIADANARNLIFVGFFLTQAGLETLHAPEPQTGYSSRTLL
jgi:hypothetical protein